MIGPLTAKIIPFMKRDVLEWKTGRKKNIYIKKSVQQQLGGEGGGVKYFAFLLGCLRNQFKNETNEDSSKLVVKMYVKKRKELN